MTAAAPATVPAPGPATGRPAISARGLEVTRGGRRVLGPLDLDVAAGSVLAVVGRNGAGKSTLLGTFGGYLPASAGELVVAGRRPTAGERPGLLVGYVGQPPILDGAVTVVEALVLHGRYCGMRRSDARRRSDEVVEAFDLHDLRDTPVGFLSGGQKQRVALARAVLHRPAVLLLDEPLTGVDVVAQRAAFAALADPGRVVVVSTHELHPIARHLDRIVALRDGGLVADERPDHLLARYAPTAALDLEIAGAGLVGGVLDRLDGLVPATAVRRRGDTGFVVDCATPGDLLATLLERSPQAIARASIVEPTLDRAVEVLLSPEVPA